VTETVEQALARLVETRHRQGGPPIPDYVWISTDDLDYAILALARATPRKAGNDEKTSRILGWIRQRLM